MTTRINDVWTIIDDTIKAEALPTESINSMADGSGQARIVYAHVFDNQLYRNEIVLSMWLLKTVTVPTLRTIIKEIIYHLRSCKP